MGVDSAIYLLIAVVTPVKFLVSLRAITSEVSQRDTPLVCVFLHGHFCHPFKRVQACLRVCTTSLLSLCAPLSLRRLQSVKKEIR